MEKLFKNLKTSVLILCVCLFASSIAFSSCTGQESGAEDATEEVSDEHMEDDEHHMDTEEGEHPSDTTADAGEGEHPTDSDEESEHPDN